MPSSGYGIATLFDEEHPKKHYEQVVRLIERAKHAMQSGMFPEWLASFVAAWEETHDVDIASFAGLEEWDL